ncbi:hypothetical protein KK083_30935 [Fulvivirgaceae bacterium PWU4]|uniref:Uncharacterized protein n=1 Tax=Chryseosolibacter histidini TaxID=2782349 RepID=A0AAP2GMJ7_9BACT|nr:hypothetical protein [Chryseosolibacter histidini]MBT1701349.1 hypothetical protein [Chryseosolibacter histidini]
MADKKIPGIHNYCDRWCERCAFGSRCAVYENESGASPEQKDIINKAFWERLSENFSKAHKLLEQAASQYGVNLSSLAKEVEHAQENEARIRKESQNHPLSKLSWNYSEASRLWLKSQPGMIKMLEQLSDNLTLGVESVDAAREKTVVIKDCLAVIQWYQAFIHLKLMRAIMGKLKGDEVETEEDQRDYDGSAKIGIIAIERSIQAWVKLFELLPDQEDEFLKLLAMLEKMKTMAKTEFPAAERFKRPGFDD